MNTRSPSGDGERSACKSGHSDSTLLTCPPTKRGLFGRYRIRGVLGTGGMATVYLAELRGTPERSRFCALKVPSPKYSQRSDFRAMFELEAKLSLEISHPHVCRALEWGEFRRSPYLVMELLKGRSLLSIRKAVRAFEMTPRHALRISRLIADACDGLQAVHDFGLNQDGVFCLVHHDISPDNLVLNDDGFVKILDFGLARMDLHENAGPNELLRGKVSYTAPELIDRQAPSPRTDVWGLGVVAWELLVGRPLFHEVTDTQTLRAVQEQPIVPPSRIVPSIPKSLDTIVLRALARNPAERFQSALEFGRALWRFMVAEQEVVQHAELAGWLHTLFPTDRAAFAALHDMHWDASNLGRVWPPEVKFWAPIGSVRRRAMPANVESHTSRGGFASSWFDAVNSRISAAAAALVHDRPRTGKTVMHNPNELLATHRAAHFPARPSASKGR